MTVLLPREAFTDVRRVLLDSVALVQSPFSLSRQAQDWGGRAWSYEIDFAIQQGRQGRQLSAFFAQIGRAGTFLLRDPGFATDAAGSPLVMGAGQTGVSLVTDGWPVNSTVLRYGDAFQIGTGSATRLHQLTQDAVSGPTGVATLNFVPALRYAPADNAPLEVQRPAVLLQLVDPVPAAFGLGEFYQFTLKAVEAI